MFETILMSVGDFSYFDIFLRIGFGAVIGLCLGMTGVGGGVLIIPVLRGVFAMSPVMAVGTASLCASLMKISSGLMHVRNGNVDWKNSALILLGAAPILIVTSFVIVRLSDNPATAGQINQLVEYLIIGVIAFSLIAMIKKTFGKSSESKSVEKTEGFFNKKTLISGAATGFIMGSTGVGGGVLLLPLLSVTIGLDMKRSVGSSTVIALVLSSAGALAYSGGGQSDVVTAALLVLGSFVGVPMAGFLLKAMSDKRLQQVSLGLISVSAVVMLRSMFI